MEERYTIRILYRSKEDPAKLVGLVEEAWVAERRGFVGMAGLWRILGGERGADRRIDDCSRRRGRRRHTVADLFPDLGEE